MRCRKCKTRTARWRKSFRGKEELCDECFIAAAQEGAGDQTQASGVKPLKTDLRVVQKIYQAARGLRLIAQRPGTIGTDLEEFLQAKADEIEGAAISVGEKLGWTLDDVIAREK